MAKITFRRSNAVNISTPSADHASLFIDVADGYIKVRNPDGTVTNYGPGGAISAANSYTDSKIADLIGAAPELLDTLKEISDAINSDPNFSTSITALISQESADRIAAISAEQTARENADNLLQQAIQDEQSAREMAEEALQNAINNLTIDSLTDVDTSSAASGQILRFNGASWLNESPISSSDGAGGGGGGATWVDNNNAYASGLSTTFDPDNTNSFVTNYAVSFQPMQLYTPSKVKIKLQSTEASVGAGQLKVELRTDNNGAIGDLVATSAFVDFTELPGMMAYHEFNMIPPMLGSPEPQIVNGSQHWVVVVVQNNSSSTFSLNFEKANYGMMGPALYSYDSYQNSYSPTYGFLFDIAQSAGAGGSSDDKIIKTDANGRLDSSFLQYNVNFGNNQLSGVSAPMMSSDAANKGYVDDQVSSEAATRQSADEALDSRIDSLEADSVTKSYVDSQDAATLSSAQSYADQKVADLVSSAPAVLDTLQELAAALGNDENFASTVAGQIGALDGRLDQLEADPVTKSYVDSEVDGLDGRVSALEADPTTKSYVDGQVSGLDSRLDSLEADPTTKSYVDGEVSSLDGRLDALEADPTTKSYVDGEVAGLDGRLDALEADPTTKSYVDGEVSAIDVRLDALEADPTTKSYVDAADAALQSDIDTKQDSLGTGTTSQYLRGDLTWQNFAPTKYVASLSWSGEGPYTMSIPAATHGMGTDPVLAIRELIDSEWVDCVTVEVRTNADGDITISTGETFDGKVVIK
jgi:hypothetical protein